VIDASRFDIHTEVGSDLVTVRVSGELDIASVPRMRHAIEEALGESAPGLVVDLSALTFIDSSGLRELILLNARAVNEGWTLSMVRPSGATLAVFELTGADRNLPFGPQTEAAAPKDAA
jgi:anti-anti-sigma factor